MGSMGSIHDSERAAEGYGRSSAYSMGISMQHVFDEYHRVIGLMSPSHYEKLDDWLKRGMEPALIAQAILEVEAEYQRRIQRNEPGAHQVRRMTYLEGILRNWFNDGLRTYYDWDRREDEEFLATMKSRELRESDTQRSSRRSSRTSTRGRTKEEWGWEV